MNPTAFPDETALRAILRSDASLNEKATACQQLAVVGSAAAVAELITLVSHEALSGHALIALEAIATPEVPAALMAAASKLEDRAWCGVILTLGRLREKRVVEWVGRPGSSASEEVRKVGIAALGMVGTPAAGKRLEDLLRGESEDLRADAGHAALIAAERLHGDGHPAEARALLQVTLDSIPDGPIFQAAERLVASFG